MRFVRSLLLVMLLLCGDLSQMLWSPSSVYASGDGITPKLLTLTSTFESVGVEVTFGGDGDGDATAMLAFKRIDDAIWRNGLPLWRTSAVDGPGPAFYGSALLLEDRVVRTYARTRASE